MIFMIKVYLILVNDILVAAKENPAPLVIQEFPYSSE